MAKSSIDYTNRDFESIRNSLIDHAKRYYPDTFKDFNEAGFGSLMIDTVSYVGDMINEEGESNYTQHKKIMESLTREFQKDINSLVDMDKEFDSFFEAKQTHPLIIKLLMREEINL